MNIIFLDIDGVLNGYNFFTDFSWKIARFFGLEKLHRKYIRGPFGIHEKKVKKLSKIVKKTKAKIVLSTSLRYSWDIPYENKTDKMKKLTNLFNLYNIEVIGITPKVGNGGDRDKEILTWLATNESQVDNFIILDDENTLVDLFCTDERFIQTSDVPKGVMIMGKWNENTGLKNKHVQKAIRILNKK